MMFYDKFIKLGQEELIENVKILLYKEDENIFDFVDFDNDQIYLEPFLFAYFNREKKYEYVKTLLFGYSNLNNKSINTKTDIYGRIYIPNIGWLITKYPNEAFILSQNQKNLSLYFQNGKKCEFLFEKKETLEGTNIELIKYPHPLLDQFYYDVNNNQIEVEIEKITSRHLNHITNAYKLIKKHAANHFYLISKLASKCVIFNVDTFLRNSFYSTSVKGMGFYNAYQEDYEEIFFIDDIAHQTGHAIFDIMLNNPTNFFNVSPETIMESIQLGNLETENRPVFTVLHALYTYYTTFICLDACLSNHIFSPKEEHEGLGRIAFYLLKCRKDLKLFRLEKGNYKNLDKILTDKGLDIFLMIEKKWEDIYTKYYPKVRNFKMNKHPYNFTYKIFNEQNPLDYKYQ